MDDENSNSAAKDLVIVSGLPRSGTSMMMRMLEAGGIDPVTDHVRTADVDNPAGYYEFEPVKRTKDDPSWIPAAQGKAVKMVYQLVYDMPADYRYRVLLMRRDMQEMLQSQRKMLDRTGQDSGPLGDEQMADLFSRAVAEFEAWVKKQSNIEMLEVSFNRVQNDPRGELARVNEFLGGRLNLEAMVDVVDAKLYRNRKPQ